MAAEKTRAPLVFTSRLKAAPRAVFDAFFDRPTDWLCRQATIERRLGGVVRLWWPDGCFEGRFLQYEPPDVARFSWRMQDDQLPETMVVIHATELAKGETGLELEHYGFGVGGEWDMMYVGAARAWAGYLKNLRAVLETGVDLREEDE
jgi:uncharacterized protein YndB with AHSA1/START domain